MKRILLLASICASGLLLEARTIDMTPYNPMRAPGIYSATREEVCLNGVWDFTPVYDKEAFICDEFPDPDAPIVTNEWSDILVPCQFHERGLNWTGMRLPDGDPLPKKWRGAHRAWYRRTVSVPEEWKNKTVTLRFDGVAFYAKVFVNGQPVGEHFGPVTRFTFDVSDKLRAGEQNTIHVYVIDVRRVQRAPAGLRGKKAASQSLWMILADIWQYRRNVAGIWKDVFMEARPRVAVDDIYAMPSFRNKTMGGRICVKNNKSGAENCTLVLDVLETDGKTALEIGKAAVSIPSGGTVTQELSCAWSDPKLWDLDQPNLYYLRARLVDAKGQTIDEQLVRFGFKEVWVDKDQIYMNGRIVHALGDWITQTSIVGHLAAQRHEYARYWFRRLRDDCNFVAPRIVGMSAYDAVFDAADEEGFLLIPTGYAATNFDPDSWDIMEQEWTEYIKAVRNHPCVFIWSQENESVCHEESNTLFMLEHRLDMITRALDPMRPYYHDGHAMFVPEKDAGVVYENGDLCGTAPISGIHYGMPTRPQSAWLHEFDRWRRRKPVIYGEAGVFNQRTVPGFANIFYGAEKFKMSEDDRDQIEGKVFKMVLGCWRSYGVPGIMALGVYGNSVGYDRLPRSKMEFKWNNLTTPGPKISDLGVAWFNPYDTNNPTMVQNVFGEWQKRAFAPFVVTLYRDLKHNFVAGQKAEKTVWLVNDSKADIDVGLEWRLSRVSNGNVLASHEEDVTVSQGVPVKRSWSVDMPEVDEVEKLVVNVSAKSSNQGMKDEDNQEISVYPLSPVPALKKHHAIYDTSGRLKEAFDAMDVKYEALGDNTFEGDAKDTVVWVGPYSANGELKRFRERFDAFIRSGGVLVVMNQNCNMPHTATANEHCKSVSHPLFEGLADSRIYFWSGRSDPMPDNGMPSTLGNVRSNVVADSTYSLPDEGCFIKHLNSFFEMFNGSGCLVGCNLLLAEEYKREPEARLLLHNLMRYADGFKPHETMPLYFAGPAEAGERLVTVGVPLTLVTPGMPVSSNNPVLVTKVAEIGNLEKGVLLVGSLKELAPYRADVEKFTTKGGVVIALPQNNETWDEGVVDGAIKLVAVGRKEDATGIKTTESPMLWGLGTMGNCKSVFTVDDSTWNRGYRIDSRDDSDERYALLWKDVGRGKIVLNQSRNNKFLVTMLANLGVAFDQPPPGEYMGVFDMIKTSFVSVRQLSAEDRKKYYFVNLKYHMNAVVCGKKFDRSMNNVKFRKLPLGEWVYGGGIPFHVVDPDTEELMGGDPGAPNNVIILRGARMPGYPEKAEGIKIGKKTKRIYFMHTSSWALRIRESVDGGHFDVVNYRVTYADGSEEVIKAKDNINIRDWFIKEGNGPFKDKGPFKDGKLAGADVAWAERNQEASYALATIWMQSWENPHPDKEIKTLDIISENTSVPLVLAVTLELTE